MANEWGQYPALAALITLWPGWRKSKSGQAAAFLGAAAAVLLTLPAIRAFIVARRLPAQLAETFGPSRVSGSPISIAQLFYENQAAVRQSIEEFAPGLKATLYRPLVGAPSAAILAIHGGSWRNGGRDDFRRFDAALASAGFVVMSCDYRLAPAFRFPSGLQDVKSALSFLRSNADRWNFDPERIFVLGRSAGGQLAELLAFQNLDVRGLISFYAPSDMLLAYSLPSNPRVLDSRGILDDYLGGSPARFSDLYSAASPLSFAGQKSPPTLLIHGLGDDLVWPIHEERLQARLKEAGRPVYFLRLPWATHGCDVNPSGPCGQLSLFAIRWLLTSTSITLRPSN